MNKKYNWTTKMVPLYGLPMYDNDSGLGDLPIEFHPRNSYDDKFKKLNQLINNNYEKYHLSMIDSPTDKHREDIKILAQAHKKKSEHLLLRNSKFDKRINNDKINILQEKVFSYHIKKQDYIAEKCLKQYDAQYKDIERPFSANYIRDNDFFAYRRVAGNNPFALKIIKKIPDNFPVKNDNYKLIMKNDDLKFALEEKRLYMLDFANLQGATAEKGVNKEEGYGSKKIITGYSYMAMALFAVSKKTRQLKSVCIQCGQDPNINPMIYAYEGWIWERAKLVIQVADETEHQLYRHLGIAHLTSEVFALATYRNFEESHPLYKLLISHMEGTNRINHNGILQLFGDGQFVDTHFADELSNLTKKTIRMRLDYDFYENFLPADLKNRGVDDVAVLPVYPYRDDSLLYWNAINDWVNAYIRTIYPNDFVQKNDHQLTDWMKDIVDNGKIKGFKLVKTRNELADVLTMIIFTSSVYHAAANFTQIPYMMYAPGMPGSLFCERPNYSVPDADDDTSTSEEEKWVATLSGLFRALSRIGIYTLLGGLHNGYLGEYVDREEKQLFSENDDIYPHLQQFRHNLKKIEKIISERNKNRPYPYETLMPKNVPASVNI